MTNARRPGAARFLLREVKAGSLIQYAAMKRATPEQIKSLRRRGRALWTVSIGWGVIVLSPSVFGRFLFGPGFELWLYGMFIWGALIVLPVSVFVWRCPVCGSQIPKGSDGKHCQSCDTSFEE